MLPYIALQLKAVSQSVTTIVQLSIYAPYLPSYDPFGDVTFIIALTMAAFAVLFGTRHVDATEHQNGLMLAIATESVVKIAAFLIVGAFITYWLFGGIGPLIDKAMEHPEIIGLFARGFHGGNWLTVTFLSSVCILLLTRQFHVTIVENNSEREDRAGDLAVSALSDRHQYLRRSDRHCRPADVPRQAASTPTCICSPCR